MATVAEKSPEVEEMEIVTSQLSTKLCIEDIDAADGDNPQLCAPVCEGDLSVHDDSGGEHKFNNFWSN